MILKEQVELARPGARLDVDFEFVDYSDGNGQVIRRIESTFDIPTQAELDAVLIVAQERRDQRAIAKANIKAGQVGGGLPDAIRRIEDLEAIIEEMLL